jgi:hypothetical protein
VAAEGDRVQGAGRLVLAIDHGRAIALLGRDVEVGVDHAERLEDALYQKLAEIHAGDPADQEAEDIGGVAVVETLARGIGERQGGEGGHPGVGRHGGVEHVAQGALVGVGDRADRAEAVGEPCPVGHQVLDGDIAGGRVGLVERAGRVFQDLHVLELGRPAGDRIIQIEFARFEQHQGRHRSDRLGHRGDAEEGVALHRRAALQVALARGVDPNNLAPAPYQGDRARQIAGGDHAR